MSDELSQLTQQNADHIQELEAKGINLNPIIFLKAQLDLLVEMTLGWPAREVFDSLFEKRVETVLENVESEITRAKLTEGITPSALSEEEQQILREMKLPG